MHRRVVVLALVISGLSCLHAQTLDESPLHHHHAQEFADGSVHPELIPDSEARRLFLIALAQPFAREDGAMGRSIRAAHFRKMGLSVDDQGKFSEVLGRFREQYEDFVTGTTKPQMWRSIQVSRLTS